MRAGSIARIRQAARYLPVALLLGGSLVTPAVARSELQPANASATGDAQQEQDEDGGPHLRTGTSHITRIEVDRTESPTFDGRAFGDVGPYKKVVGKLFGVVDPRDPRNRVITDLDNAPRNADGLVEYATDFYLLTPVDGRRGNHALFSDVVNRGNKLAVGSFDQPPPGSNSNDPTLATDAGNGFLFNEGYTVLWVGWQGDLLSGNNRIKVDVPIATNHGQPFTSVVRAEFVNTALSGAPTTFPLSEGTFTGTTHQSYASVSPDNSGATLTKRLKEADPRQPIPNSDWSFASCPAGASVTPSTSDICFPAGFQPAWLYELIYTAKDPKVLGVGLAAMRDATIFFRSARTDDAGNANPLADGRRRPRVDFAVLFGASQSGRLVRTFEELGFNSDARGDMVYEALWPHIAPGKNPLDVHFGQPGRAYGQHEDHLYPVFEFPVSYAETSDPITHQRGSILDRCEAADNCPHIIHTISSLEYWQGKQSLDQTDPLGQRDLRNPSNVRMYLITGTQHGPAAVPTLGMCQQLNNPNPQAQTLRALLVDLRQWVEHGVAPPPNAVPNIADGTLVSPNQTGFPSIPGVTSSGLVDSAPVLNFGPRFIGFDERGVISIEPPQVLGQNTVKVPRTDSDGNDAAGVRPVATRAPIATGTGWNLQRAPYATGELCGLNGMWLPFATTRAERLTSGDPRLSLQERYGTHDGYIAAVRAAANQLVAQRFLLADDAQALIEQAQASNILR